MIAAAQAGKYCKQQDHVLAIEKGLYIGASLLALRPQRMFRL